MMSSDTAVGYIRLSQDGTSLDRQQRDVEAYADIHDYALSKIYNEGKRASGFSADRPEYNALLDHIKNETVDAVIVPNLSRLSRDRKERLRLLLDVDRAGVQVHSVEINRPVDLDNDWELVHQSIQATTDDVEKRKEIERSKRATKERISNGFDHGRPPFGLTYDESGHYWVPDQDNPKYHAAVECIRLRDEGRSWRDIESETGVSKDTALRIFNRREYYQKRLNEEV